MLTTRTWHSLHVYVHRPASAVDAFLLGAVAPVLDQARQDSRIGGWFFIRYWEGGPHLRVRLRDASDLVAAEVRNTLEERLSEDNGPREALDAETYYGALGRPQGSTAHGWHQDGSVVYQPYEPEVARYGGETGLMHSEDFFVRSTQVALTVLRHGRERPAKLQLAFDAIVATVRALGIGDLEIPIWLRQHVGAWAFSPEAAPIPAPVLRAQAEREFADKGSRYRAQVMAVTRATAPDAPRSFAGLWHHDVREVMNRYRAAAADGVLTRSPLEIAKSQLHMFLNRLGLSMADEFYLCWLVSLACASLDAPGFFDDGTAALDRQYHEHSKYAAASLVTQRPDRVRTSDRRMIFTSREEVALPSPLALPPVAPLSTALLERRTARAFGGRMSALELSSLLYYSAATVGSRTLDIPETADTPARSIATIHRPYPSAGAKYSVRLMLLVQHVDGIAPAVYLYQQDCHVLTRVGGVPALDTLNGLSPLVEPGRPGTLDAAQIPVWMFAVADFEYARQNYGLRSYRFTAIECGHIGQNVSLTATALGLASAMLGGYYDDAVNQLLCIDGVQLSTMYVLLIGKGPS